MPDLSLDDILQRQDDWILLAARQAKETYREVFKLQDRYIIKRFSLPGLLRRYRRPWEIEHRALTRLNQPAAPRSLGWIEREESGRRIVTYVRDFIPGIPLQTMRRDQIPTVACLFTRIHRCGVVTDDANVQNFIETPEGQLHFIDFGRARVLPPDSNRLYFHIGEEFAKFVREGLAWDREAWRDFISAYEEQARHRPGARALIQCSFLVHVWTRRIRKVLCGRPANS